MKPIIGISAGREIGNTQFYKTSLAQHYSDAIIRAGGTPVIIPPGLSEEDINPLILRLDGIMLSGGGDVESERFHGKDSPKVSGVDSLRDDTEIKLVLAADINSIPCLGICRGHQVINVAFGGQLYTDISSQAPNANRHDWYPNVARDYRAHVVQIREGSKLEQIIGGNEVQVNSLHHQAVSIAADPLIISAFSPDGIIEAVEKADHPFMIGVQWHPEWLVDSPAMKNLFSEFVIACKNKN